MEATDWAERIPAAIAKGEAGPQADSYECGDAAHENGCRCDIANGWPLAGEVALAKALWDEVSVYYSTVSDEDTAGPWHALRAFCTKVEAL